MAKFEKILAEHHVLRWARPKEHLLRDHDTEEIRGFDPSLFKLRDDAKFIAKHGGPEKSLSVNYVEHFEGTDDEMLKQTVSDYRAGLKKLNPPVELKKKAIFTKMNVGEFKDICHKHDATGVRVIHDAKPNSTIKSHGSVTQLPQDKDLLLADLATFAFNHRKYARDFWEI